jgi:RNA polymerase sigma-70 factor (ECF subfamily)
VFERQSRPLADHERYALQFIEEFNRGEVAMVEPSFSDLLRRVRSGEAEAAVELVRQFEPTIRIAVRRRLNDPYLNRMFDSMDICQSVLASFFLRAAAGQYELHSPEDLLKLLSSMARKKLAAQARRQRAQSRDSRRVVEGSEPLETIPQGRTPDSLVANRELLEKCRALLTEEERRLVDLRAAGHTWAEIAQALGGQAQARRRQLDRALDRVSQQLGLEEGDG